MTDQKVSITYMFTIFGAVFFTWILHEFAHWITYESFGLDAFMTLNASGLLKGQNPFEFHRIIAAAAGPFITLIQASLFYVILMRKGWRKVFYPLVFIPFYMRFLAGIMNFIKPNDEGVIGLYFGMGLFTISIVLTSVLFWMVYKIAKKYTLRWKFQGMTILLVMLVSSFLILLDQFVNIRLL